MNVKQWRMGIIFGYFLNPKTRSIETAGYGTFIFDIFL
jgi:hypothetical protein